jgi:UDP-N-acetyl-D-glucosamine/UDP-N-acetyl-D-galactosamine dehydrogenase
MKMIKTDEKICVIGLGYVGLPLLIELLRGSYKVAGYDISEKRISDLKNGIDTNEDIEPDDLPLLAGCLLTTDDLDLKGFSFYVIAVPTPVDDMLVPDLRALKSATTTVGKVLSKNAVVVYESTVYPGCTEDVCKPILESESGLTYLDDFNIGFSPERIVPGDRVNTIRKIKKITSGSNDDALSRINSVYSSIVDAGVVPVASIKIAEMSKIIENTQRDINIALVNEIAIICNKLCISTQDVLDAAGTKWNFLPFRPGLVGGHCIGVDPYYLTYKAQELGYHPEVILSGRRINDRMPEYVVNIVVRHLVSNLNGENVKRVLLMGATFKENCKDIRNSKALEVYKILDGFGIEVDVYDPLADNIIYINNKSLNNEYPRITYDAVIVAVAHDQFKKLKPAELGSLLKKNGLLFDIKSIYKSNNFIEHSIHYKSL